MGAGQIEFMVLNGSVGLSLKETEDRSGCEINTIQDNSQGFDLGFQIYDQFLHINNKLIPKDETAFDVVMSYLQNEPRPARIVMYRPPEAPEEEEEEEEEEDVEEEPEEIIANDTDIPLKKEKSEEGAFDLGMFGGDDSDDTESDNDGEVDTKKQKFSNSKITQAKKAAKNIKTKQAAAKAKKAEKKKQKEGGQGKEREGGKREKREGEKREKREKREK